MISRPVERPTRVRSHANGAKPRRNDLPRDLTDQAIRSALRTHVLKLHSRARKSVLLEEVGLCRGLARMDVVVVNGRLHGYEIKSDRDSLRRLPAQVKAFGKVFDRLTLVVGDRHRARAGKTLPRWWGIIQVTSTPTGPHFRVVRRPEDNPRRDPRALVELLWADDARALLEARGAARGVRAKPRRFLWDRIVQQLELSEIAFAVRGRLKARGAQPARQ